MAAISRKIPSYRLHKPSGQGVVRLDGADFYLGKHGTPESHQRYDRAVAEWLSAGAVVARDPAAETPVAQAPATVAEVILAFWKHAQGHYHPAPQGGPSDELVNIRVSCRPLNQLYGMTPARDFGPKSLRAVRERMLLDGLARTTINARINRLRHVFKWAASHEMIPVAVVQALATVEGLQRGRTAARETEKVGPVPREDVARTLPFLTRPIAGMVRMQLFTGMRPGEVCMMRGRDITRDGSTWTYRPATHKSAWRGKARDVILGPQAQALVEEFTRDDPDAYLFDPAMVARSSGKKEPKGKGGVKPDRPGKVEPDAKEFRRYSRSAYTNAVFRACPKASVTQWSPNQLRHTFATEVRASHGLEAAQTILGHPRADTTQIYAERDTAKAREVIARVG